MLKKTWSIVALAALLLLPGLAVAQSAPEADAGNPKLVVPEKVKDFGTVAQGEQLKANFELRNEGTAPVEVKSVRPTCGCTVASYDKKIAPGATGSIAASVDTTNFSGPIAKSLLVLTNDPETPNLTLVVKAEVQPHVEVLPRPLVRFNAVQGDEATDKVTLVSSMGEGFSITGVESSVPYISATSRKLGKDEMLPNKNAPQYEVSLAMAPDAPVGPVNATVMVHTDDPKAKEVPIRVFGVVRALVHVTPPEIQFGTVDAKLKPGRNVLVINNRPQPLNVTGATVDDATFATQINPLQEGQRYQVTVTIRPDAAPGTHSGTLTITTTDPRYSELTVPVAANVQ